jgi:hypothetical protein
MPKKRRLLVKPTSSSEDEVKNPIELIEESVQEDEENLVSLSPPTSPTQHC